MALTQRLVRDLFPTIPAFAIVNVLWKPRAILPSHDATESGLRLPEKPREPERDASGASQSFHKERAPSEAAARSLKARFNFVSIISKCFRSFERSPLSIASSTLLRHEHGREQLLFPFVKSASFPWEKSLLHLTRERERTGKRLCICRRTIPFSAKTIVTIARETRAPFFLSFFLSFPSYFYTLASLPAACFSKTNNNRRWMPTHLFTSFHLHPDLRETSIYALHPQPQ